MPDDAKTLRQKVLGSTIGGKLLRAVVIAAAIAAGGVVADQVPALRPVIAIMINALTGIPASPTAPEKAAPPANEPAPNQEQGAVKKG